MTILKTILDVLAAGLCVIGLYASVKWIGEVFLTPKPLTAAVVIRTHTELAALDLHLADADRHSLRTRGHPPVVLIDRSLADRPEADPVRLDAALAPFGAAWYIVNDTDGTADTQARDGNRT